MPSATIATLLDRLEESKRRFDARARARTAKTLAQLARRNFTDAHSLLRFHEILLFLRAYPQSPAALRRVENILASFARRVERLRASGADLSPLAEAEVSGIAGTSVTGIFTYDILRWLVRRYPKQVSIDWEGYEEEARLGATWPRFLPLLEEEALVEANVPYLAWLGAAMKASEHDLTWLLQRFERLPITDQEQAELFDSLKLWVRWEIKDARATRTGMKLPPRVIFYHQGPLLSRSDVSLVREMETPPLPVRKLPRAAGERILDMARSSSLVRYRELYGFTYGDPSHVLRAEAGRGVEIFVFGVPPERRLPLRAYHAGLIFKNGVAVGYVEGLSLFERMEIGFNLYYTFRDGESAWLYARLLRLFRQLLGVTVFSVDPYQIGFENEEGIASGAFWFYRKLGFRPVLSRLMNLTLAEERRITRQTNYRTPAQTLRQLSTGHIQFETPPAKRRSDWDRFHTRNLGFAVERRMAKSFGGDARRIRRASSERVARALGVRIANWEETERRAFDDLALILALIPDLARWTDEEKRAIARIVRAKAGGAEESRYLRLLQSHPRLRREVIKLGS